MTPIITIRGGVTREAIVMTLNKGIAGDAYPQGTATYRQWLSRTWDPDRAVALVVGINPNTATESQDDGMTRFLTRLLRGIPGQYECGGFILVNCCDYRAPDPKTLKHCRAPVSPNNLATVRSKLVECDFVVASWGTTNYGRFLEDCRDQIASLVRHSGKPVICFSPRRLPIYCGARPYATSRNSIR